MLSKGARIRGGSCKLARETSHGYRRKRFFSLSVGQHSAVLSQDVMEQFGDTQHLVGEGTESPHLSLMPVKERNYKYI